MTSKNKLTTNHTYLTTTNYWAPLYDEEDDVKEPEQIKIITAKQLNCEHEKQQMDTPDRKKTCNEVSN